MRTQHWDDDAFKRWTEDGADGIGITVADALKRVGVSRFYFKRQNAEGRSINVILNLAALFNKSPAPLFGMPDHTTTMDELMRLWRRMDRPAAGASVSDDPDDDTFCEPRLGRMIVAARIFATQLASLVCVASDRADTDPAVLMQLILREFDKEMRGHKSRNDEPAGEPDEPITSAAAESSEAGSGLGRRRRQR